MKLRRRAIRLPLVKLFNILKIEKDTEKKLWRTPFWFLLKSTPSILFVSPYVAIRNKSKGHKTYYSHRRFLLFYLSFQESNFITFFLIKVKQHVHFYGIKNETKSSKRKIKFMELSLVGGAHGI